MPRKREPEGFFTCPNCGAEVPRKALACPNCGSDDETGWSEEAKYVHLLPDREDYSLPPLLNRRAKTRKILIPLIALVLAACSLLTTGIPGMIYIVPVVLLLAAAYYIFHQQGGMERIEERRLFTRLVEQTRGDREMAERLVSYEARRHPEGTRRQHIADAIDRWQRDRR